MDFIQVGYYQGRAKARVPIDKGTIRAAFGERPDRLRVEALEGMIVLTAPQDPAFTHRHD